jgi:hypothetical protein
VSEWLARTTEIISTNPMPEDFSELRFKKFVEEQERKNKCLFFAPIGAIWTEHPKTMKGNKCHENDNEYY